MLLKLVDADTDLSVEIPVDSVLQEAVMLQMLRLSDPQGRLNFATRLSGYLTQTVRDALDPDLQGPTDAQLVYALAISKQLGVSLPSDALRYKGAMSDFIGRHQELYRAQRAERKTRND